ncbi:MAG TPA: hypothetical protein PKM88_05050 [bacterium]|nr:hypothetical protein [bacterium]
MNPPGHVLSGIVAAAGAGWLTGSLPAAGMVAAGAVLIDADHLLDAWHRRWTVADLTGYFDRELPPRMVLPLHYWELWGGLGLLALAVPLPLLAALAAGALLHLALDQCTNPVRWSGYFFVYRLATGFSYRALLTPVEIARREAGQR